MNKKWILREVSSASFLTLFIKWEEPMVGRGIEPCPQVGRLPDSAGGVAKHLDGSRRTRLTNDLFCMFVTIPLSQLLWIFYTLCLETEGVNNNL